MRRKLIEDGDADATPTKAHSVNYSGSAQVSLHVPQPLGPEHYGEIEAKLGYTFIDRARLECALTHRSVHGNTDYERLEFLGDAVFDLAVADLLLHKHQNAHEGELSKMRAALVNKSSLAEVARRLDLGKFIKLSRSELASGAHERPSILADVVEAVIGAVYTEAGFTAVYTCIGRLLGETVATVTPRDPKTELQEVMHASNGLPPVYKLECVEGPEHSPVFISVVEINGEIVGRGRGTTKKASQQAAAEQALALVLAQTNTTQGLRMVKSLENVASDSGDVVSPGATQVTQSQEEVTDE